MKYKNNSSTSNQEKIELKDEEGQIKRHEENSIVEAFNRAKSEFQIQYKLLQTQRSRKSFNEEEYNVLARQLALLEKYGKSTFEYNFYTYLAGNFDTDQFKYLERAAFLSPGNFEVWEELLGYYHIVGNVAKSNQFLDLLEKKKIYDNSLILYAKDVLKSVNKGVILTHGEKDSYPLMIAKKELGVEVEIINVDFLTSKTYKENLRKKGYILPKGEFINTDYVKQFLELNKKKGIHVALSLPEEYLKKLNKQLATKGLTYLFGSSVKVEENKKIWKSLDKSILQEEGRIARVLRANYIPLLKVLYQSEKESEKKTEYENLVLEILKGINREDQLNALLHSEE